MQHEYLRKSEGDGWRDREARGKERDGDARTKVTKDE